MKKFLYILMIAPLMILGTSCGDSNDEPTEEDKPQVDTDTIYGGIYTIIDGDTISLHESTIKIPSNTNEYILDVYSTGINEYDFGAWRLGDVDAELLDNFNPENPNLEPVEWKPRAKTADEQGIADILQRYPMYHQRVRITIGDRSKRIGLRVNMSTSIYLCIYYFSSSTLFQFY